MTHTPEGAPAPEPSRFEPQIGPTRRARRLRIASNVTRVLRALRLDHDDGARREIFDLLDRCGVKPSQPPSVRACAVCFTPFEHRNKFARFCCDACRVKHWRDEQ